MRDNSLLTPRRIRRFLLLVAGLYLAFLFPSPEYPFFNKDDGSLYLTLGVNLAEYGRYTMDTAVSISSGLQATWPPAFPAFLALIVSVAGVNWFAIKLGMVVLGVAAIAVLWRLLGSSEAGRIAVLLTALNPFFFLFSHHTMAEVPYILGVASTLLLLEQTGSPIRALVAGLVGAVTFLARGYAVALLPAGVAFLLLRSERPFLERLVVAAAFALPILAAVVGWAGYTAAVISSGQMDSFTATYGNGSGIFDYLFEAPLDQILRRIYWHDARYALFLMLPVLDLSAVGSNDALLAGSVILLGLAAIGWLSAMRDRVAAVTIWMPFAFGLLLMSNRNPAVRYWLPLLPYLFYFALIGVGVIASRRHWLRVLYPATVAALLSVSTVGLVWHLLEPDRLRYYSQYGRESLNVFLWARGHTAEDSLILTEAAGDVYVAAQRRAASLPTSWPPPQAHADAPIYLLCPKAAEVPAHYPGTFAACTTLRGMGHFAPVYETPQVVLYQYIGQGAPPDAALDRTGTPGG